MPCGAGVRVGLRVDDQRVGVAAVGDPHLAAVEHVAIALRLGAQLHADHVRAGIRLAHRQRADVFAGDQLGQVLALLRLGCRCGGSGSRTGSSARRTTGRPRPTHARPPPSPRCAPGSPCRCRRIPRSPSCRAGPARRASSTGRRGTGCRRSICRRARRDLGRRRTRPRCRAACRWFHRARSSGRAAGWTSGTLRAVVAIVGQRRSREA